MWLALAFLSAALLGFYDVFKKQSLKNNAVIPVLFLNTLFCSLIFLPFIVLLTISTSGFQSRISLYVLIYEKGLAVSSRDSLSTGTASSSAVTYCVFPGKRNSGYCLLKLNALTMCSLLSSP